MRPQGKQKHKLVIKLEVNDKCIEQHEIYVWREKQLKNVNT